MNQPHPDHQPPAATETGVPRIDLVDDFTGPHRFLSMFSEDPVLWRGHRYRFGEAAFHAGKTLAPEQRAWIAAAETPVEAKRRGQRVSLRPGWDTRERHVVMREVIAAKFAETSLSDRLQETGGALLIEGNTWHDQFWGCCKCSRHSAVPGQNWLGRYLMQFRALQSSCSVDYWPRVACTGHRPQGLPRGCEDWLAEELRRIAAKLRRQHGTQIAISGAAAGSDLIWAEAALDTGLTTWLYQPYVDHDTRWPHSWRDRLAAARAHAGRIATLGTCYSVEVLHSRSDWMIRDGNAIIAVVDPLRRTGGTVQALSRVPASTPIIRVDVRHRQTTLRTP